MSESIEVRSYLKHIALLRSAPILCLRSDKASRRGQVKSHMTGLVETSLSSGAKPASGLRAGSLLCSWVAPFHISPASDMPRTIRL